MSWLRLAAFLVFFSVGGNVFAGGDGQSAVNNGQQDDIFTNVWENEKEQCYEHYEHAWKPLARAARTGIVALCKTQINQVADVMPNPEAVKLLANIVLSTVIDSVADEMGRFCCGADDFLNITKQKFPQKILQKYFRSASLYKNAYIAGLDKLLDDFSSIVYRMFGGQVVNLVDKGSWSWEGFYGDFVALVFEMLFSHMLTSHFGSSGLVGIMENGLSLAVRVSARNLYSDIYNQVELGETMSRNLIALLAIAMILCENVVTTYHFGLPQPEVVGNRAVASLLVLLFKLATQPNTQFVVLLLMVGSTIEQINAQAPVLATYIWIRIFFFLLNHV